MNSPELIRGFDNPVQQSQEVFRLLMKAMSEPGVMVTLPSLPLVEPLNPASYGAVLALMDQATPLWLSPNFNIAAVRKNLHFHTGVPFTQSPNDSHFALIQCGEAIPVTDFPKGSAEYPENSTTVIVNVDGINNHKGTQFRLSGPGIATQRELQIEGIQPAVEAYLLDRPDEFPTGLDFIFCCGQQLVCIPRSTLISSINREAS